MTSTNSKDVIKNGSAYQCYDWNSYVNQQQWLNDVLLYMQETNSVLCTYRKDLNEVICQQFTINPVK